MGSSIVSERDPSEVAWGVRGQEVSKGMESSLFVPFLDSLEGKK